MKASVVQIGDRCTVGNMAVVLYDTEMKDGSSIGPLSLLMKGETLAPETRWLGIPTAEAARPAAMPPVRRGARAAARPPRWPATWPGWSNRCEREQALDACCPEGGFCRPRAHGGDRAGGSAGRILRIRTRRRRASSRRSRSTTSRSTHRIGRRAGGARGRRQPRPAARIRAQHRSAVGLRLSRLQRVPVARARASRSGCSARASSGPCRRPASRSATPPPTRSAATTWSSNVAAGLGAEQDIFASYAFARRERFGVEAELAVRRLSRRPTRAWSAPARPISSRCRSSRAIATWRFSISATSRAFAKDRSRAARATSTRASRSGSISASSVELELQFGAGMKILQTDLSVGARQHVRRARHRHALLRAQRRVLRGG